MKLADAYATCERITRREAKNFALGIMLLPKPKREALTALYAFARRVDDIADGPAPAAERRELLDACRASLDELRSPPADDAVLLALGDAMLRYPIPKQALLDLVEGGLWDVERSRYADWAELREYCLRVAGAVGVACTAVYGPSDPERALPLARTLGIALQQINIMRDVSEDLARGRVYLPQDELLAFGVAEADLAATSVRPGLRLLLGHQAARARGHLAQGMGIVALLDRRSALCVRALAGVYEALLEEIERAHYEVLGTRHRVPASRKLGVAASAVGAEAARALRR